MNVKNVEMCRIIAFDSICDMLTQLMLMACSHADCRYEVEVDVRLCRPVARSTIFFVNGGTFSFWHRLITSSICGCWMLNVPAMQCFAVVWSSYVHTWVAFFFIEKNM